MTVREKYNQGDYDTKLPAGVPVHGNLRRDPAAFEAAMADYRAANTARKADHERLLQQLKNDLEQEYGILGHPKADLLWEVASEHYVVPSNCFLSEYDRLVALLK